MKTRLYNARILTMAPGENIFMGEVHTDGERITHVGGPATDMQHFDREIDCKGNLLMPGFKNAHTHSGMTVMRSMADDLPLNEWLRDYIFPTESRMTADDIYWLSKLAIMEYLTTGATACMDMYFMPDAVADAMADCGFRCVLVGALNDHALSPEKLEQAYGKYNGGGNSLLSYILGFHAEYTTCLDNLRSVAALAQKLQTPVCCHACETKREVDECNGRYGMTPLDFLDSLGMFDYGGGIYHGVCMSERDFEVMSRHGLFVTSCPGSNVKLASGMAPIAEYLKRGITVALGTDGPASNNCLDIFREMFLVTGLAKLREQDAAAVNAMEVLKMATVNGAKAMRLHDCDVLKEGKLADIVMINLASPNMQPLNNIAKNLVYSGSKANVELTMVNGTVRYYQGEFNIGEQPGTVYNKVNEIAARLMKH